MITRSHKAVLTVGTVLICAVAFSALPTPAAFAQAVSVGAKAGVLSGEFSAFTEIFLMPSVSASLGLGIQSSSFTVSLWTTIYPIQSIFLAPYVGLGTNVIFSSAGVQAYLMLLAGLRFSPPPIPMLSLITEFALLTRIPSFNPVTVDMRVGLALRF